MPLGPRSDVETTAEPGDRADYSVTTRWCLVWGLLSTDFRPRVALPTHSHRGLAFKKKAGCARFPSGFQDIMIIVLNSFLLLQLLLLFLLLSLDVLFGTFGNR